MKWWDIKAAANKGEVRIYGYIAGSDGGFFGSEDDVTPKGFADELKAMGDVKSIDIYINSRGGDPFAANAIYAMLKRHSATKTVYIDGLAASAASQIAMAGDKVVMASNGLLMIHMPSSGLDGTAADFRKAADALDMIAKSMMVTYREKSGLSDEEIMAIMEAETWFTPEEAVAKGFADEVATALKVAASLTGSQATINGQVFDISKFHNFPKDKIAAAVQVPDAAEAQARLRDRERRLAVALFHG